MRLFTFFSILTSQPSTCESKNSKRGLDRSPKLTQRAALIMLCTLSVGFAAQAQLDSLRQPLGEWRLHPSFSSTIDVTSCNSFSAYATENSLVLRYHDNGEIKRLDKSIGLSQANLAHVVCNPARDGQLVVAYRDGAIEVLEDEVSTHYITAITNASIEGRRDINRLRFIDDRLVLVAADFGYLFFDAQEGIFLDDVRFSTQINDAAVLGEDLFLATATGLRVLRNYRQQSTLRDTTRYENLNQTLLAAGDSPCYAVMAFQGQLYAGFRQNLYAIHSDLNQVDIIQSNPCKAWTDLNKAEDDYLVTVATSLDGSCTRHEVWLSSDGRTFSVPDVGCIALIRAASVSANGRIAIAGLPTEASGKALFLLDNPQASCTSLDIAGPRFQTVFDVEARNGVVAIAAGGLTPQENYTFNLNGIAVLRDGRWNNYNFLTRPVLNRPDSDSINLRPADFISTAIAPNDVVYGGAYFEGLYAFKAQDSSQDVMYDENNSSLQTHIGDPLRVRIGGLRLDSRNNLWVANYGARRGLSVRTAAGEWHSFDLTSCRATNNFRDIAIAERFGGSPIVFVIESGRGLLAFNANGTFDNPADDQCRLFGVSQGLQDSDVRSILVDQDNTLWIGTNNGVATINCGDVFNQNCEADQPISESVVDSIRGLLLEGQNIRAMAVDGGNRKWIGTSNGMFLIAPRSNAQLAFYNEDNSPLASNSINTLSFDESTGILWIGTDIGLQSFQTESTGAGQFDHAEEIEIFPQPVRPEFAGLIAMRGFAQDSNVKITDLQGRLVYETNSIGGTATWDGRDYTGRRPASGIYYVWATATLSLDKPATVVGKIALLR